MRRFKVTGMDVKTGEVVYTAPATEENYQAVVGQASYVMLEAHRVPGSREFEEDFSGLIIQLTPAK